MNRKKFILFSAIFLFLCLFKNSTTYSYTNIKDAALNNNNTKSIVYNDVLSKEFMLETTPIGSKWHYRTDDGENLLLVLTNVEKTENITSCVSLRGVYSKGELFSNNAESLFFKMDFIINKNTIIQKAWDSNSNSYSTCFTESTEDFSPKKLFLNIDDKLSIFSLKYILVPDEHTRKNMLTDEICQNQILGEKIIFSKQNDVSMDWYRGIDDLEDEYYSNGAHHTILMMLHWLYSDTQDFKHRPIYMFGENNKLTDESVKDAISVYSDYIIYPCENVTEELITHNLNKGYILILKLNPQDITHETNIKSHKNIYYFNTEHYIIIKGFAQIDNSLYFTIYDPFSLHEQYENGSYKGKNRFYKASDILDTINNTGTNVYVIKQPKQSDTALVNERKLATQSHQLS